MLKVFSIRSQFSIHRNWLPNYATMEGGSWDDATLAIKLQHFDLQDSLLWEFVGSYLSRSNIGISTSQHLKCHQAPCPPLPSDG